MKYRISAIDSRALLPRRTAARSWIEGYRLGDLAALSWIAQDMSGAAKMSDCFLTLKRTAEVLGVSTRTLRRMIAAGSGPQVTQLSVRRLGVRQSHLTEWSAGKLLGRFKVTSCDISSPQRTVGGLDKRLKKHANGRS